MTLRDIRKRCTLALLALAVPLMNVQHAAAAETQVEMLNELLKGELSAVETYRQALEKLGEDPNAVQLRVSQTDHQFAVTKLKAAVEEGGGTAATSSGAWGTWAKAVTGTAKLLGDTPALKALKEGEEHGIKEYQEALENANVSDKNKELIRRDLLPKQSEHIAVINRLMAIK